MNLKDKFEESKAKTKKWVSEHQGDIIYGCYVGACILAIAVPAISKARRNHMDATRDRRIYDRSNGFYWETKRNLTNNQKLIIEERHMMGESYGSILSDMNLLKR